jgi:hypothetical protein
MEITKGGHNGSIAARDYAGDFDNIQIDDNGRKILIIQPYITRIGDNAFDMDADAIRGAEKVCIDGICFKHRRDNMPLTIGYRAFYDNSIGTQLIIPSFVTSIDNYAFCYYSEDVSDDIDNFSNLERLIFMDRGMNNPLIIGDCVFGNIETQDCRNIELATLPQQFTAVEELIRIGINIDLIQKVILCGSTEYNNYPIIKQERFKQRADFAAFTSAIINRISESEIPQDRNTISGIRNKKTMNIIASFLL